VFVPLGCGLSHGQAAVPRSAARSGRRCGSGCGADARTATPDTQNPDAAMTGKMMAAAALLVRRSWQQRPTNSYSSPSKPARLPLARLSEPMVSSGSVAR
jgi:hypothetical protein